MGVILSSNLWSFLATWYKSKSYKVTGSNAALFEINHVYIYIYIYLNVHTCTGTVSTGSDILTKNSYSDKVQDLFSYPVGLFMYTTPLKSQKFSSLDSAHGNYGIKNHL